MKIKTIFLIFLLILCLSGCDATNNEQSTEKNTEILSYDAASVLDYKTDSGLNNNYDVARIPIKVKKEFGEATAYGNFIYYTQAVSVPMTQGSYSEGDVVQYDINTKESKVIYSFPKTTFSVNELKATKDKLFWVMSLDGEKDSIEMLDIAKNEVSTVKKLTLPPVLSCDEDYLTWYEYSEDGTAEIFAYEIATGESRSICKTANVEIRAIINDNIVSYVSNEDNGQKLVVFNVKSNKIIKEIKVTKALQITHCQANEDYIIWSEGYYPKEENALYGYDMKADKLLLLDQPKGGEYLFHFHLLGDSLLNNNKQDPLGDLLVENNKQVEDNNLIVRNISTATESNLTEGLGSTQSYDYGQVTADKNFMATDNSLTESTGMLNILYIKCK